jgi:hypothetical protein
MVDYIYAWKFHIDKGQTENKDETAENPAGDFLSFHHHITSLTADWSPISSTWIFRVR